MSDTTRHQQAQQAGIDTGYFDISGQYHQSQDVVLQKIIHALNTSQQPIYEQIHVITLGDVGEVELPADLIHAEYAELIDENGNTLPIRLPENENDHNFALDEQGLDCGYYVLRIQKNQRTLQYLLIVAPAQVYQPSQASQGLTLQLYSLRSAQNWGIGDFGDLCTLIPYLAKQHIDFIGINPLHALYTSRPDYASPYSPSSRLWLNPIYLNVPQIGKWFHSVKLTGWLKDNQARLQKLRDNPTVDYSGVWATKHEALQLIFQEFFFSKDPLAQKQRQEFTQFVYQHGERLRGFALFETLDNHFANHEKLGWLGWDEAYHQPNGKAVQQFATKHETEIRFHMWLQWLCALQMQDINQTLAQHGMNLGLYGDLSVSVALGSADTWLNRDAYCLDMSIGAPPDPFSPIGQNWQLPPYHPRVMQQTGFTEFIQTIRENMKWYGILRIDHVMALNRLWWITGHHESAANGAYVHYPQDALFAIVALESHRHQCVVVGEDLGTVPDSTRELLNRYHIFSYKVLYFHQNPENFPANAIAVVSTHDLAPLAGYWQGEDLCTMFALGTLPDETTFQAACQQREHDKAHFIHLLKQAHCLPEDFRQPENMTDELLSAFHQYSANNPSLLYATQMENLLGMTENFNVPGVANGYPNWAQKLPQTLTEIIQNPHPQIAIINEVRMKKQSSISFTKQHRYPTPDQAERDTINRLFMAEHDNVFAYLGRHHIDGVGDVVRAILPNALAVEVVLRDGTPVAHMEKWDERGFWAVRLPENTHNYALHIQYAEQTVYQEDPYRFGSHLGQLDSWLLAEGKHLRPYERLGAHLREIDGVKGVFFAVWAPNAQRVSVVGEFNHWDGRVHVMRKHVDTGIWEMFIPHVPFNALYKFEMRDANGNIRVKSDPYAFASELRPTTASVVRGLPSKMPVPAFRKIANQIDQAISIYEVHLGSWKRHAKDNRWLTYTELADDLIDYVKNMGFTHIELLPLSEYPFDGSWGYQATGLYAPTSRFGSPQELQYFMEKAHNAGISVILDWVVGHFPTDEHGLAKFDGTALYEHADPREGFHQDWNTLIYNFGRNEVRNFLMGNALYWVERFGFDGLRVDAVASMIYRDYSRKDGEWIPNQYGGHENLEAIDFLRDTNTMLQAQELDAVGMAEESTAFAGVTKAEGLNFQYKWNMGWMNDTLRYMKEDPVHRKYHHNLMTFGMMYQYSENYILPLSHDEVVHGKGSLLGKMRGDCWQQFANLRAYYGFMFGYPGKKLLFMGCEFAQGREWNFNEGLDWFLLDEKQGGSWHKGVQDFVRDLNFTYRQNTPLYQLDQWQEGFEWLVADDADNSVFVFERRDREDNRLIVISNFTPVVRENYRFGVNVAGEYHVILNSDNLNYKGSGVSPQTDSGCLKTENIASHGREQSLNITLPPLSTVYLSLGKRAEKTDTDVSGSLKKSPKHKTHKKTKNKR